MYRLSRIAEITGAVFSGGADHEVSHFMFDSRSARSPEETLFVALSSGRTNGHDFIPDLLLRGFRSFLVKKGAVQTGEFPAEASFLSCEDPLSALQSLAEHHRKNFNIPVIGITGSNGKTVVKEWLYQLLKGDHKICRSPKSFNSQIGVPLSVLQLRDYHTLAIFEAGISRPGEMQRLSQIINPDTAVFTSFGTAHNEGFPDPGEKMKEKLLLFNSSRVNIFNHVDLPPSQAPKGKNIHIGGKNADWQFSAKGNVVRLQSGPNDLHFELPFIDEASQKNAATCAVVLMEMGYSAQQVSVRLQLLQPVALRLEIKSGVHNSLLINDFYNSDLDSLQIALDHLKQQGRRRKKVIVLSDIEQSGLSDADLYRRVARQVHSHGIDFFIGIGERISAHSELFGKQQMFFRSTQDFVYGLAAIKSSFEDATVLLKGARSFEFETISRLLQQKSHDTVFEIDLSRLVSNVNYYRGLLAPGVRLMCMVKAMGYGSGGPEIARSLQHIGVNYLAVAYADEGMELRQSQVTVPVMVMNPEQEAFDDIIQHQLEPELYSMRVLEAFAAKLDALGIAEPFPVHLKIDTGMRRLGFTESDLPQLIAALQKYPQLRVQSVFSHLVGSEDPAHDPFTGEQLRIFRKAAEQIEMSVGHAVLKHICNSAGISRFPEAHFDMVRLGIGMYGVGSSEREQANLVPVGTLRTRISQLRHFKEGDTVGYGRRGKVNKGSSIAVVPIGYADGFSRLLGNGAHGVYINGAFCKTVGNICMDMCMVDITGVWCEEGDEVIIFNSYEQIVALSKALGTIPYEVLTNVSARVKRVYTQE